MNQKLNESSNDYEWIVWAAAVMQTKGKKVHE